jgi:hypothetical protein
MIRKSLIALIAAILPLVSCVKEEPRTELQLNLSQVSLTEGETLQLTAAVLGLRTFVPVRQKRAEFLEGHLIQILYHGKQLPVFKNANGVTAVTPLL